MKNKSHQKKTDPLNVTVHQEGVASNFSGPIPPPQILQGYESVVAGSAERILAMAEQDADHQRQIEQQGLENSIKYSKTGQWFGFLVACFGIAGAITCTLLGYEIVASVLGLGPLSSLVGRFLQNQKSNP